MDDNKTLNLQIPNFLENSLNIPIGLLDDCATWPDVLYGTLGRLEAGPNLDGPLSRPSEPFSHTKDPWHSAVAGCK